MPHNVRCALGVMQNARAFSTLLTSMAKFGDYPGGLLCTLVCVGAARHRGGTTAGAIQSPDTIGQPAELILPLPINDTANTPSFKRQRQQHNKGNKCRSYSRACRRAGQRCHQATDALHQQHNGSTVCTNLAVHKLYKPIHGRVGHCHWLPPLPGFIHTYQYKWDCNRPHRPVRRPTGDAFDVAHNHGAVPSVSTASANDTTMGVTSKSRIRTIPMLMIQSNPLLVLAPARKMQMKRTQNDE